MPDYGEVADNTEDGDENYELPSIEAHLRQISTNAIDGADGVAHDSAASKKEAYKNQGVKKNLQCKSKIPLHKRFRRMTLSN